VEELSKTFARGAHFLPEGGGEFSTLSLLHGKRQQPQDIGGLLDNWSGSSRSGCPMLRLHTWGFREAVFPGTILSQMPSTTCLRQKDCTDAKHVCRSENKHH